MKPHKTNKTIWETIRFDSSALVPLCLIVILLIVFMKVGPLGVFKASIPPIENVVIQKAIFAPEQITLKLFNDGPEPVTIAQLLVNDVYWKYSINPSSTLEPLQTGEVIFYYPWVEGDTEHFMLLSSTGVAFEKEVSVAFLTPHFNWLYLKTFILLGLYVGVFPVFIGLLWFPFLTQLKKRWFTFLVSFSVGILLFLGFDALAEAIHLIPNIPHALNGSGILVLGILLAILLVKGISHSLFSHIRTSWLSKKTSFFQKSLILGYLIALGIGIHNLGEGLAIGSAYAIGEIVLGSLLVIGFMLHNITEGIAIISPIIATSVKQQEKAHLFWHIIGMGILAGAPTILGTIIGGFSYAEAYAVFFLGFGAGSIFSVTPDIMHGLKTDKKSWSSIFTLQNILGFSLGILVMYATGFLVV